MPTTKLKFIAVCSKHTLNGMREMQGRPIKIMRLDRINTDMHCAEDVSSSHMYMACGNKAEWLFSEV